MKIDNFYFVVKDVGKSVDFYTKLLEKKPTSIIDDRWADWGNEAGKIYFGIISEKVSEGELVVGNNGVLGLYTDDIVKAYQKCLELGAKVLYEPESLPDSKDNYRCFAIEDLDGNKIEIASYDK